MNFSSMSADRMQYLRDNAIRDILSAAARPGMISLAGGVPAPESFPMDVLGLLFDQALSAFGPRALQYDRTEGFAPLCQALSAHLAHCGVHAPPSGVIITSGAQGALDALGKTLITPGDTVAVESPTYLGALQAFSPYRPRFEELPMDDQGLDPEALDALLRARRVKFIYLCPTFQNPTGRTLSLERRKRVAQIIQSRGVLLIEDDPYRDLRYSGEPVHTIHSMAPDHVAYVGTLSKVFAPAFRIGYCVAPGPVQRWLVKAKQGVDLCSGTLGQALAALYIADGHLDRHLPHIVALYRARLHAMLEALQQHMPRGSQWSRPQGGMFVWVRGPAGFDAAAAYAEALKSNVAYVPGRYFFANTPQPETMRLNFTAHDPETVARGVQVLAGIIKTRVDRRHAPAHEDIHKPLLHRI